MRDILIGVLILLLSNSVIAQKSNYYIGLKSGLSIPILQYTAKNLENGCFTQTGFTVGIEGAWYFNFKNNLGVVGQFGFNLHPVDVRLLGYENVIHDPNMLDVTIRSDPYQIITGAMGLIYKWNFSKNWALHSKLLGGIMWAKTPYQLYKPEYFIAGLPYFEITPSKDNSFMGIIGAGIQINISPCVALRAEGDFQYSQMVFGFKTNSGARYDHRTISFINTSFVLILVL
jgi:hypothetical protein